MESLHFENAAAEFARAQERRNLFVKYDQETTRITEQHQQEMARIAEQHQQEMARIAEQHQQEMARIAEQHQQEMRQERENALEQGMKKGMRMCAKVVQNYNKLHGVSLDQAMEVLGFSEQEKQGLLQLLAQENQTLV